MDYANAGSGYEPDAIASVVVGVITITIMNNQNVGDLQGLQVINEGSKFGNLPGNRDTGVHESHSCRDEFAGSVL